MKFQKSNTKDKGDMYMEYRGLSTDCCQMFESQSGMRALMECVCKDPACCVEVRHNYLNCYYRGGSLFRIIFKPKIQKLEFKFDPKYFALKQPICAAYEALRTWNDSNPDNPEEWLERLDGLKQVMDNWLSEHPKAERETQQEIVKLNTFARGNYQAIDIELAIPKNQKAGRMDIIAVRREGERFVPVIVELKHGTGAFDGKSGIGNHYDNIIRFLNGKGGEEYLVETIRRIWKTKRALGLLKEPVPAAAAFDRAELLFAVTGWLKGSTDDIRKRLPEMLSWTVRVAVSPTKELYFDNGVSL